jgi:predicted RecA/RadA family phage recombinase
LADEEVCVKNFVQPGQYGLTVTAPANVTGWQLVIVGAIFGVAAWDATAGTPVEISPEGVVSLRVRRRGPQANDCLLPTVYDRS